MSADPQGPDQSPDQSQGQGQKPTAPKAKKPHPVTVLYRYFSSAYDLVHCEGQAYAVPGRGGHLSPVGGVPGVAQPFGAELRRTIVRTSRLLPDLPKSLSRADADAVMLQLDADAHQGPETVLGLRFHYDPAAGQVCLDLGDDSGRCVVIDAEWWSVEDQPPPGVLFRRSHSTKPLPLPEPGGRLDELAQLLALDGDGQTFRALVGWLLGLPFDDGRSAVRPGLLLTGPYGSGKSTRLRLATSVLEPSGTAALGSAFGRNFGDDQVRALHRAVPLWDNLTSVSGAVSDALCCLVTGTARETRALYSDNELNVVPIRRPIGLTAVGIPAGLRPDALDRLVTLEVEPIAERVADTELQARFDAAHPQLLGALCTALSAALAYLPKVDPPTEHRMAGHAHVLAALDAAREAGDERTSSVPNGLLEAFSAANRRVKEQTAAEDVFGGALLTLLEQSGGQWQGKASELLMAAGPWAPFTERAGGWPSSARRVPEVLNHLREGLAALGVTWSTSTVRGSTRYTIALQNTAAGQGAAGAPADHGAEQEAHPNAHPFGHKPTPMPTPAAPALTCGNAFQGARGGHGGRLPAALLLDESEKRKEEEETGRVAGSPPPTPTTPTPGAAPPGEPGGTNGGAS